MSSGRLQVKIKRVCEKKGSRDSPKPHRRAGGGRPQTCSPCRSNVMAEDAEREVRG